MKLDLESRTRAMVDMLEHPGPRSNRLYIVGMAVELAAKCYGANREDLGRRICEALA